MIGDTPDCVSALTTGNEVWWLLAALVVGVAVIVWRIEVHNRWVRKNPR